MSAVEAPRAAPAHAPADRAAPAPRARRLAWPAALLALLAGALALRLWGLRHGLPYAYNADENAHFVPRAIGLYGHALNPDYFVNPPAFTYALHLLFTPLFGGRAGVSRTFATDPGAVFAAARVLAAVLGTAAVGLLALAGARLLGRRAGLVAAGVLAVAFLPVFYGHLALNDVPTLAPIGLALVGVAGVVRRGRRRDFALAGLGLGLACATKYTGGVVLLPLLAAGLLRGRAGVPGLALAAVVAAGAFVAANPYAVLTPGAFLDGLAHQSTTAGDAGGKLGLTEESGLRYYGWVLTWGLGWVPAVAALGGAVVLAVRDRALFAVLVPAPVLFGLFMATQERFFGRWLLPVFPFLCLLAAVGALALADALAGAARRPRLRPVLAGLAVLALCLQGLAASVHLGRVLSAPDTRGVARAWLVANLPEGARIVVEPGVVPDGWAHDVGRPSKATQNGYRWVKYPTSRGVGPDGRPTVVDLEDYERTLRPETIDLYTRGGFCHLVSGSTQSGRAFAEPGEVPGAIAYYRRLDREAEVVLRASPWAAGETVPFSFDWSFDFYPRAYRAPGPLMTIYRLRGGACA